jgi:hypothetical protein
LRWIHVRELQRGMTVELTGSQTLWDTSASPWRKHEAGSRFLEVVPGLVEIEVAVPHLRLAEW